MTDLHIKEMAIFLKGSAAKAQGLILICNQFYTYLLRT
jgi:hypothetical protein